MIAILSTDPIVARMLLLETERCELSASSAEAAAVWLLDLDHPPRPMPKREEAYVIGFSATQEKGAHVDLLLPLPYPTAKLHGILRSLVTPAVRASSLRHLPGIALLGNKKIPLSPTEERLYLLLLKNCNQTVAEAELLSALGDSTATTNVLQVHIYRLRRKLSAGGASLIRAVRGQGYRMVSPTESV